METGGRSCFEASYSDSKGFWRPPTPESREEIDRLERLHSDTLWLGSFDPGCERFFVVSRAVLIFYENRESPQFLGFARLAFQKMEVFMTEDEGGRSFSLRLQQGADAIDLLSRDPKKVLTFREAIRRFVVNSDFCQQYKLLDLLGQGGFSRVYKARHKKSKQLYAAKLINHDTIFEEALGPKQIRFEIEILREAEHPNVASLVEVHEVESFIILVLELADGTSLNKLRGSFQTLDEVKGVAWSLIRVVAFLHAKGIVHRDIKPANIVICNSKDEGKKIVKLIDFGMAGFPQRNQILSRCGTPGYVAPEILKPKYFDQFKVEFNSDVFSVGIVLFELVYGTNPFGLDQCLDSELLIEQNATLRPDFNSEYCDSNLSDPSFTDLLTQMLERNPTDRPQAAQLLNHKTFQEGNRLWLKDYSIGTEEELDSNPASSIYSFKVNSNKFKTDKNIGNFSQDFSEEFVKPENQLSRESGNDKIDHSHLDFRSPFFKLAEMEAEVNSQSKSSHNHLRLSGDDEKCDG